MKDFNRAKEGPMDGEPYTMDRMQDIIRAPNFGLVREVTADGKAITFEGGQKFVEENFIKKQCGGYAVPAGTVKGGTYEQYPSI